jgi:hypothetical protein
MFKRKNIQEYIKESSVFQELYQAKNKWLQLIKTDNDEVRKNLYVLIDNSYGLLGAHSKIDYNDLFKDNIHWEAIDTDADPAIDAVVFSRKTVNGMQIIGVGHDGVKSSRSALLNKLKTILSRPGYYMEVSGHMINTLHKLSTPYLSSEEDVKILYPNIKWNDSEGSYTRDAGNGQQHEMVLFGRPVLGN